MFDQTHIALFLYNRPHHTQKTIESIFNNDWSEHINLYIFLDGPKNKEDKIKQKKIKDIVKEYTSKDNKIKIRFNISEENQGLANSIIRGITSLFNEKNIQYLIVLEDDILTSNKFIEYMRIMDNKYSKYPNISTVSAFNPVAYEMSQDESFNDINMFLHSRATSWGWATWKDSWEKNVWSIDCLLNNLKSNPTIVSKINRDCPDIFSMLEDQKKMRIDSWAVRWVVNQYLNNFYTIYPKKSFVQNIGFDEFSTHTNTHNKIGYLLKPNHQLENYGNKMDTSKKVNDLFSKHFELTLIQRLSRSFKKMGLFKLVKFVKKTRNHIIKLKNEFKRERV